MNPEDIKPGTMLRILPGAHSADGTNAPAGLPVVVSDRQPVVDSDGDVYVDDMEGGTNWYVLPEYLESIGDSAPIGVTFALPPCPLPGTVLQGRRGDGGSVVFVVLGDGQSGGVAMVGAPGADSWSAVLVEYGPLTVIGHVEQGS